MRIGFNSSINSKWCKVDEPSEVQLFFFFFFKHDHLRMKRKNENSAADVWTRLYFLIGSTLNSFFCIDPIIRFPLGYVVVENKKKERKKNIEFFKLIFSWKKNNTCYVSFFFVVSYGVWITTDFLFLHDEELIYWVKVLISHYLNFRIFLQLICSTN